MMSDKDNNLLKSDILTVGSELSEKLNAIGVPNTFGKASEGKDNLMSIIRMTINGLDMTIDQIREILRDYYNKSEVNTLLNGKSDTSHNHDSAYANISHNHDNAYASKSHQHDGADVILSNNNDVGTEIGTIEDDITSINGDITSLNNSITNLADTTKWIYYINNDTYKVRYNKYRVNVDVSITGTSASTTLTQYGAVILSDELRPKYPVSALCNGGNVLVLITDTDNKLYRKSMTGSNQSNINIYGHLEWDRR